MRYKAPPEITEIFLSVGTFRVDEEGFIVTPDEISTADATGLCGAGFEPAPAEPAKPAKASKEG